MSHILYIPIVMLFGGIIGFVVGRKVGVKEGRDEYLGGG